MLQSFSYHFQSFFFLFQFKCSHYSKQEKLNMYIASGTCNFIDCLKSKIDLRFGGKLENEHLMGKFRDITPTLVYTDAFEFWNFQMICQSLSYSTDTDGGTQVGHQFLHVASPCGLIFLTTRWLRAPRVSQPMRWKLCCLLLCSLRTKVASLLFFFSMKQSRSTHIYKEQGKDIHPTSQWEKCWRIWGHFLKLPYLVSYYWKYFSVLPQQSLLGRSLTWTHYIITSRATVPMALHSQLCLGFKITWGGFKKCQCLNTTPVDF